VFGVIDVGYATHKSENAAGTSSVKSSGVQPGNHAGSRLGFRGEEDLGGGLKAAFHYEWGVAPNKADGFNQRASGEHPGGSARGQTVGVAGGGSGGYTMANNRQSWIQLAGGFGSIRAGYLYTTAYNMVSLSGLAASEMPGHRQNATTLGNRSEAIQYTSPKIGDITVAVQIGQADAGENETTSATSGVTYRNNVSRNSLNVLYTAGPLYLGLDYAQREDQNTGITQANMTINGVSSTVGSAPTNNNKRKATATNLGARYDLGVAQVAYIYGQSETKGSAATASGLNITSATATIDATTNALTVFVPLGAAVPFVQYGTTDVEQNGVAIGDITGSVVGARYNISKRTLAYVMHGQYKDKKSTQSSSASAGASPYKETRTVVGLAHSF
jgi:predicted porin